MSRPHQPTLPYHHEINRRSLCGWAVTRHWRPLGDGIWGAHCTDLTEGSFPSGPSGDHRRGIPRTPREHPATEMLLNSVAWGGTSRNTAASRIPPAISGLGGAGQDRTERGQPIYKTAALPLS